MVAFSPELTALTGKKSAINFVFTTCLDDKNGVTSIYYIPHTVSVWGVFFIFIFIFF
jgi:hypothetical protein